MRRIGRLRLSRDRNSRVFLPRNVTSQHGRSSRRGNLLFGQGRRASGKEAVRLLRGVGQEVRGRRWRSSRACTKCCTTWASRFSEQAERASREEAALLFAEAGKKYEQSLAIKLGQHRVLHKLGSLAFKAGKARELREKPRDCSRRQAEKYEQALAIKPDDHVTLSNWGGVLTEQAKRAVGEGSSAPVLRLGA